jgi:hypothetical protein
MAPRRSAKEWARLIRELERSGQTPRAFARARGIRPETLTWWRWRLRSEAKRSPGPKSAHVKLVAVRPSASEPDDRSAGADAAPAWELTAPSGHTLRVYDRAGLGVLEAALSAIAGRRRR